MLDKLTESMQFSAEALKLRARRQEVLTSNIANVDTPNYKAVDLNFAQALRAVTKGDIDGSIAGNEMQSMKQMSSMQQRLPMAGGLAVTHAGHLNGNGSGGLSTETLLQFRRGNNASMDGNTVDIERERAAFAENSVKYEAALRSINGRISTLKQAMGTGNQ